MTGKKIAVGIFSALLLVGTLSVNTATASSSGFSSKDKKQFVSACVDGVATSAPSISAAVGKNYCACAWTVLSENFTRKQITKQKKSALARLERLTEKNCASALVE